MQQLQYAYCSFGCLESVDVIGMDNGNEVDCRQPLPRNTALCCMGMICDPGATVGRGCCCPDCCVGNS